MKRLTMIAAAALIAFGDTAPVAAAELRGSPASMQRQNRVAQEEGHVFARTTDDIYQLLEDGRLVELPGSFAYEVIARHPYALPEVRVFIERFGEQYFEATGERLVVTSLVRASTRQPRNAHALSVHPAGMAIDLRVPANARARAWLESALLNLERRGVLDATRERTPPHYHVALFPGKYRDYVEGRWGQEVFAASLEPADDHGHEHADPVEPQSAGMAFTAAATGGSSKTLPRLILALFGAGLLPGAFLVRKYGQGRG
jgi:hypothetical protein